MSYLSSSTSLYECESLLGVSANEMPLDTFMRGTDNYNYVCSQTKFDDRREWTRHSDASMSDCLYPRTVNFTPSYKDEYDILEKEMWDGYSPSPKKLGRPIEKVKKFSREPTSYNKFIKEKMQEIRNDNSYGGDSYTSPSEIFQKAASSWKSRIDLDQI